jgi:hypothetical protein
MLNLQQWAFCALPFAPRYGHEPPQFVSRDIPLSSAPLLCSHQHIVCSIAAAEILWLLFVPELNSKLRNTRLQKIAQVRRGDQPSIAFRRLAAYALDEGVGKQPMPEVRALQRLLIPACSGKHGDVRLIAVAAEALVVAVAGMAGVEEQDAAALGALDGLLESKPGNDAGADRKLPSGCCAASVGRKR